jgi:hypothetical protein
MPESFIHVCWRPLSEQHYIRISRGLPAVGNGAHTQNENKPIAYTKLEMFCGGEKKFVWVKKKSINNVDVHE